MKQFPDAYPRTPACIADPTLPKGDTSMEAPIATDRDRAGKLEARNA